MTNKFGGHKELFVWQKAIELVVVVYRLTAKYPKEEMCGRIRQTRRAAVSIPSNIAEGQSRSTNKDFVHFLRIAYASGSELETQVTIAERLGFAKGSTRIELQSLLQEVQSMIVGLSRSP